MASNSRVCRLCRSFIDPNRSTALFTTTGVAKELGSRISSLLGIPVVKTYGLSSYVCRDCSRRIKKLEEALNDLKAFQTMARASLALFSSKGPSKRPKESSGDVGVSPDTQRCRPKSKQARKRLCFTCKLLFC